MNPRGIQDNPRHFTLCLYRSVFSVSCVNVCQCIASIFFSIKRSGSVLVRFSLKSIWDKKGKNEMTTNSLCIYIHIQKQVSFFFKHYNIFKLPPPFPKGVFSTAPSRNPQRNQELLEKKAWEVAVAPIQSAWGLTKNSWEDTLEDQRLEPTWRIIPFSK